MISVLILTRNEEHDISGCLASVSLCDDVHVFDSCSTDRTAELARAGGAHVWQRAFDSYAAQRNAALETCRFKHRWVFILDCDERLNPSVWREALEAVASAPDPVSAFRVRRNDHFLGRRLKHAPIMAHYTRLVRLGRVRYTRDINEVLLVDGETRQLRSRFDHWSFSKGFDHWFSKHNRYSSMEARICADESFKADASWRTALFHSDFHTRRRAQKAIFYTLPARPLLRWLYILVARGGVLDGKAGVMYATLQAMYEWQIVLKTREMLEARALKGA